MLSVLFLLALLGVFIYFLPRLFAITQVEPHFEQTSKTITNKSQTLGTINEENLPYLIDEIKTTIQSKGFNRAEDLCNQILGFFPEDTTVLSLLIDVFLECKNYAKAEVGIRKLINLQLQMVNGTKKVSPKADEKNKENAFYQKHTLDEKALAHHLVTLGDILGYLDKNRPSPKEDQEELKSSYDAYHQAIRYDERNFKPYLALGRLMEKHDFPLEEYLPYYLNAFRVNANLTEIGLKVAKNMLVLKDYPQAIMYYNKVLHNEPKNKESLAGLGIAYLLHRQLPKARDALQQAVDEGIKDDSVFTNLATVYAKLESYDMAVEYYNKAIAMKPSAARHYRLGKTFEKIENNESAKEQYLKATELKPKSTKYLIALAETTQLLQKKDDALSLWKQVKTLDAENKKAIQAIARLENAPE